MRILDYIKRAANVNAMWKDHHNLLLSSKQWNNRLIEEDLSPPTECKRKRNAVAILDNSVTFRAPSRASVACNALHSLLRKAVNISVKWRS